MIFFNCRLTIFENTLPSYGFTFILDILRTWDSHTTLIRHTIAFFVCICRIILCHFLIIIVFRNYYYYCTEAEARDWLILVRSLLVFLLMTWLWLQSDADRIRFQSQKTHKLPLHMHSIKHVEGFACGSNDMTFILAMLIRFMWWYAHQSTRDREGRSWTQLSQVHELRVKLLLTGMTFLRLLSSLSHLIPWRSSCWLKHCTFYAILFLFMVANLP